MTLGFGNEWAEPKPNLFHNYDVHPATPSLTRCG